MKHPPKIWKGRKRIALKYINRNAIKNYQWALTIKVGDWIGTCEGCNRRVKVIKYFWSKIGRKTKILRKIYFTDNQDRLHIFPGGGCVFPKMLNSEIEEDYKKWIEIMEKNPEDLYWDDGSFKNILLRMKKTFDDGGAIVDDNGQFLPEFER